MNSLITECPLHLLKKSKGNGAEDSRTTKAAVEQRAGESTGKKSTVLSVVYTR